MDPKNINWNETATNYAVTCDPGKPLREAKDEIERLKRQITEMQEDHARYVNQIATEIATERNVYRSLVLKMLNIRD